MSAKEANVVEENGADAPPAKKARGRPPKTPEKAAATTEVTNDEAPKRGRGRPRKYPPSEKRVPTGRPRGRPKGSGAKKDPADVPLASEKARNSRKPRGRPPKSPAKASA